ncbi:coagulation factor V [Eutrema salsugineum]|uniref:coagulation factor V n=1 Tax=Eutrema salsugineum TaxID=72664 RepID=UPI000CED10F1|nr:coagulation factor V [Eutrema salsugineum]
MMNTKSVAMLIMVMMVAMGMQNILVQANRPLCEFSGTCAGLEPPPSPYVDDRSFDSDLSTESPSPSQDHSSFDSDPSSESPSPSQDDSSFDSDPSSKSPSPSQDDSSFESDPSSKSPAPSSDFNFDLSPNSISPSPLSAGTIYLCMYDCSTQSCSNLGKDPKDFEQFNLCVEKCSETCMKKYKGDDIYV